MSESATPVLTTPPRAMPESPIAPGAERVAPAHASDESASPGFLGRSIGAAGAWVQARFAGGSRARRMRNRFSALTRRIILFNFIALVVLIAGVVYITLNRVDLIDERILSLTTQGRIIADALAESATTGPEATTVDDDLAVPLLRRLVGPTATRARLYAGDGDLKLDTRYLLPRNTVETNRLPPPGSALNTWMIVETIYDYIASWAPARTYPEYTEVVNGSGFLYPEVERAAKGATASGVWQNSSGELILSVAVPVQRYQLVLGILFLTTEGSDIDEVLRAERLALLQIFLVAILVLVVVSLFLAWTIARPVRALADAAEQVRQLSSDRPEIPDFTNRRDEIGDLSASLRAMTQALYARISAIEQFAADVAHEIKNPLTSLRSAVETFAIVKDDGQRQRLLDVIAHDVDRINRLVSDISDASRLDAELARERARPVDIGRLLRTLGEIYDGGASAAKARVTVNVEADGLRAPILTVRGHEGPLAQVFRNLIDNAISFSPDGGSVRVQAARRGGLVIVTVDDDGPGIPDENLQTIFNRFYTQRPESHGFGENSGLGLSISKQIVDVHAGTIEAQNRRETPDGPVQGARFIVTLPSEEA